ncbi:MAG: nuclear transport factor 2 family protein [Cyanobacteria bacterium P01_F01_bin.116]
MELIEYEGVVAAIEKYIQGAITGKSEIMKQGFHSFAQIYGYLDGQLLENPIQVLYDYVDQNSPAANLKYAICSVDRSGDVATARIELSNWHEHTYTDFFTLLKINNQWKITNKVFTQH